MVLAVPNVLGGLLESGGLRMDWGVLVSLGIPRPL